MVYKDKISGKMDYFLSLLQKHIPELSLREIYLFGEYQFRYSMSSYQTMLREPIEGLMPEADELCPINFDFESSYKEYVYIILKGIIANRDENKS